MAALFVPVRGDVLAVAFAGRLVSEGAVRLLAEAGTTRAKSNTSLA